MRLLLGLAVTLVCLSSPSGSLLAHGTSVGPNGGMVEHAGQRHVELVMRDDGTIVVHLLDENTRPISLDDAAVSVFVLSNRRSETVRLEPQGRGVFGGKSNLPHAHDMRLVVTIQQAGQRPVQVRFTMAH